jgi:glutamine synthetase
MLADDLEKLDKGDFDGLTKILSGIAQANKQVLFEGNGYSEEWHAEAARRGLPNNRTTVDALPALTTPEAKALFAKFGVLSERELQARADINWERYVKVQNIEANTALDMARTMILPAAVRYLGELYSAGPAARGVASLCTKVGELTDRLARSIEELEHAQHAAHAAGTVQEEARAFVDTVIPAQNALREAADELETVVADDLWPLPKYRELLFAY